MSSALAKFRKSNKDGDIKKAAQKVTDLKKDSLTRLKHLRTVLDNYETSDAKKFFEDNYSHIYYIFFDNFVTVESDLKQRANKSHREELDNILHIFEKILLLLPELIHKRWMFQCINRIMMKLLHPGNGLKLRRDGMRLFLIWYQILQDNASEDCHKIFLQLVPQLGDGENQDLLNGRMATTPDTYGGIISAGEITPILPIPGEKQPENITKFFFDALLQFIVSEVIKIEWLNKDMREVCFVFLFNKFKHSYLKWLLPDFDKTRTIYDPVLDLPQLRTTSDILLSEPPEHISDCRDSFIRWLTNFTVFSTNKKPDGDPLKGISPMSEGDEDSSKSGMSSNDSKDELTDQTPGSNASTLSASSQIMEKDSPNCSFSHEEHHSTSEYEIVRSVMYSTRENINIVHEIFRQALLFNFNQAGAIRRVITVYKEWFQESAPNASLQMSRDSGDLKSWLRNASYLGAIQDLADGGDLSQCDVRAGQQKLIQICVTNLANVFLLKADGEAALTEQVDICKRVLNIYRHMVTKINLDQKTWEQILRVLLCITSGVQSPQPPDNRQRCLGGQLALPIFQTLIVTWIWANLKVYVSVELWDQFLHVLSSLTSWPELIKEWAKTMNTITKTLARQVYNLDLTDLPLERLSEQKEKRRRGKSQDTTQKYKQDDHSFSRAWSKSESVDRPATGSQSQPIAFERSQSKYKSDGAGGSKSRPDLSKQRSLSGTPSPSHSRSASASSDLAGLVRSNSEGNLADPAQLAERLKQGSSNRDDQEVASLASPAETPCSETSLHDVVDISTASSFSSDRSENDRSDAGTVVNRRSRSPSPSSSSAHYRASTRTPSPTPSSELGVDITCQHKDSPTPDRDSLHIEMVASNVDQSKVGGSLEEARSVMAGGSYQGWLPDVSVILWRRMLGALGDVNKIEDPAIHASVFEHLCDLQETLIRMRENLGVTLDNQSSPSPPEFIPPQTIFSSWLFECLTLSYRYKKGKLLAYQLLCQMMVREPDVPLQPDLLAKFYQVLHQGLTSQDQDVKNVLVKYGSARIFSTSLPGTSLLILDFISACESIINSVDIKQTPRLEAITILGSLVCYPNHYKDTPALHVDMERSTIKTDVFKDHVVNLLLKAGKREPAGLARCIAVSSLGIFLYEEITHGTLHTKFVEAVNVLLATLGCKERCVAKTSSDMLTLLCDHVDKFLDFHPDLPIRIVNVICATICMLIPTNGSQSLMVEEKKLIVSMIHCVVEWCLKIPINSLLETKYDKGCLHNVFEMMNVALSGHTVSSLETSYRCVAELWQDSEYENLRNLSNITRMSSSDSTSSISSNSEKNKRTTKDTNDRKLNTDPVKLAARLMINHLINYLCHFPMGIGASRLSSSVSECQDMSDLVMEDLKPELFTAPNVQFFVLNQRTLVSFIELPALTDLPAGGVTAGLTTAHTVCRVVMRDLTGKYCWESSVLYGPPWCPKGSYFENAKTLHGLSKGVDLEPLIVKEDIEPTRAVVTRRRTASELPCFDNKDEQSDNLFDLLGYVGSTSPECLLIPGVPLNIEGPIPEDLNESAETMMKDMVLCQKNAELEYFNKHKNDASMLAKPQMPAEIQDPISPFQMCRMLVDQLGFLSWEKRCHFDLLKKSDKLLRELKNMDAQKCRETHKFAVIYVAEGQEDKNSILSNPGSSSSFEHFVAGLGWEVDLEIHKGFLGGLRQNKSTGDTAPYYATSTCEIIYHVSTRMPVGNEESIHNKMKHLGNDEVHIVWSEHTRDYRRGIIPTEFADVLIIIYPLNSGLYRIHIDRKPEVPLFGPLFNGAIVDYKVLPGLVRATAVNASRVIRADKQFYHTYFEERALCLDSVMQNHVDKTIFENFAADVFAPVLPPNSTIVESPSDSSLNLPSSSSQTEIAANNNNSKTSSVDTQVSPTPSRQSRGASESSDKSSSQHGESTFMRTARRLSMKNRKSSASRVSHVSSPPSSPKFS
ncbi:Ral GTPase-activating protein subunit alpha-2 [Mactra antiquata]